MADKKQDQNEARSRVSKALPIKDTGSRAQREDPVYGAWDVFSEDPVDAELVDEPAAQEQFGWRERLKDKARSYFDASSRQHREERERIYVIDIEREAAEPEGDDPKEHLLKLRSESRLHSERYMQWLADENYFVPGYSAEKGVEKVDAMHRVYTRMMMQSCLKPLSRGVNTRSVVQAAGMFLAMRMLSKDFRSEIGGMLKPLKDEVQKRIDGRTRSMGAWADGQVAKRNAFLANGKQVDRSAFLGKKWQRRLDDLERRERGNRELFTPESAALTEVGLMESAYWRMREPGADAKQVETSYRAMRKMLHKQFEEDGLERGEVFARARTIIGERMVSEPELKTMFLGVAHGRIVKSDPHEERIAGSDRVRQVWTGEFEDHLGRRLPDGLFVLREPMDDATHQVHIAEGIQGTMMDAFDKSDPQAITANLFGYIGGFAIRDQGFDLDGIHPQIRARMEQTETMLASMSIDGISDEEQRRVFSNAFADAMEEIGKRHPQPEAKIASFLGQDWRERLSEAVADPEAFMTVLRTTHANAQSREHAAPSGADQPAPEQHADDFQPA